jgi:hypothetical protein
MTTITETPRQPGRSLVGPIILVGLGVVLLLNNLGWLGWNVWATLFQFWTLFLIAIGLDLMFGRRSILFTFLIGLALIAALGAAVWWSGTWATRGGMPAPSVILQPLEGATNADVVLALGVGQVHLTAMDQPNGLISGELRTRPDARISTDFAVRDGTAFYTLRQENSSIGTPWSSQQATERWDLQLNPTVPLRLTLETGAGVTRADLSDLQVSELTLNSGVGQIDLTLPRSGVVQGKVNGGIGETIITIPADVAARLTIQRGLGTVDTPFGYTQRGDVYESPGYADAQHRVDLTVNGGIGAITIRIASGR